MERPSDNIIKKIQAMLNLARDKGASEEEAQNAMSMAQDMLAKYNLDMAQIDEETIAQGQAVSKEKREQTKINLSAQYKWQQRLCKAIAEANFCWYWIFEGLDDVEKVSYGRSYRHKVKRHMILGKGSNVIVVTMMFKWLASMLEDLCPWRGSEQNSKSAISWKEGCADRLAERIVRKAWEMAHPRTDSTTGKPASQYGLVLANLFQKEYQENYDAAYGQGSYEMAQSNSLRYQSEAEKRKAQEEARRAALTPKEREKEDRGKEKEAEKQKKASDKYWEQQKKKEERAIANKDVEAYQMGRAKANTINLDNDRLN